jgi:hypothetical protein
MSGPLPPDEPLLSTYMRVLRGKDTLQDLTDAFSTLKAKALTSPSTLTDLERRQLLDLPDAGEEAEFIGQVSSRACDELLSAALSNHAQLSDDELALADRRFWSLLTRQEQSARFSQCKP